MSRKRSKLPKDSAVIPLRVPRDMGDQVRKLADKAGLSDADIMRLSIERGLASVERMFEPAQGRAA